MNRNTESYFGNVPLETMKRSRFHINPDVKTSWNVGELIPAITPIEVLPGDSWEMKTSKVIRMPALITPIMQNVYLDTYWFFVPSRILWSHWKNFMGENGDSAWIPQITYSEPQVTAPSGGWSAGTLADYMGIPTGVDDISVSALRFRGYAAIVDTFFRDENLQDPVNIPMDDTTVAGSNGSNYITDLVKGGKPFIACKLQDAFTTALPGPLKGQPVAIPVATLDPLPVVTGENIDKSKFGSNPSRLGWYDLDSSSTTSVGTSVNNYNLQARDPQIGTSIYAPSNLWAIQSGVAAAATISELRTAFAIQRLLEKDARSGTRLQEILRAHFGTIAPDARLQKPEYLGGNRIPLRVAQVLQQSESGTTPQGTPVGVSLTVDNHNDFTHSFCEHGFLYCLMVVRYKHVYQNMLHPSWLRKDRLDYYWPSLAHVSEVGIKNSSIYCQGSSVVNAAGDPVDDEIFGYQEYAWEYRSIPSMVTGQMRSNYAQSLDIWHLADDYSSLPYLGDSWIKEDKDNVDRVLSVGSSVTNQLFGDIHFEGYASRVMPYYSVPGLIDHY